MGSRGRNTRRTSGLALLGVIILASCTADSDTESGAASTTVVPDTDDSGDSGDSDDTDDSGDSDDTGDAGDVVQADPVRFRYPDAPPAPDAGDDSNAAAAELIDRLNEQVANQLFDFQALAELAEIGDARHAWYISDLLRFFTGNEGIQLVNAFEQLTGVSLDDDPDRQHSAWLSATNHLIAWDTPDYPGYQDHKAGIFLLVEPEWTPFFEDDEATVDWRYISWGGVLIDDRELGDTQPCAGGCIPALDDPAVTDAAGGDWYPDERIVFGIVEGDDALAIPLNIAEIHEMFNLSLGGRRLGIPYCTLCGSAQAYYTDDTGAPEEPVLRTSGLLSRSNKVMYDLRSGSVFDTFTGEAASGPLREAGVQLTETTVVRSTWGEWKEQHPETTIIAEDGGIERVYALDPLAGRDADGPIFPIGEADDRLPEQELVVGVITPDGTAIAFRSDLAGMAVELGETVELNGVTLTASGDGLVAAAADGTPLAAHESFWFAWSQFHPETLLWDG